MNMSLRAYAKHRSVALSAVQKALATGRIHKEPDGSIDPVKADAQWDAYTRIPTIPQKGVVQAKRSQGSSLPSPVSQPATSSAIHEESRGVDYHKARAVRETYAARLAKLEFEVRSGKLINADDVETRVFNLARKLRDRIQQIPRKVAPEIVALVVVNPDVRGVTDILDAAIREALEELTR